MKLTLIFLMLLISTLSGCGLFSSNTPKKTSSSGKVPKVSQIQKPGGDGDTWRYLGTANDGQLVDEINDSSISSGISNNNTQIYNFQDRKTVIAPKKFSYPSNQPHFKYLLSTWQMDCNNKMYLLNSATLYNESGVKIINYNYANDSSVTWLKFTSGNFAQMQYDYICTNKNRNLGY